jgi:hypothetical protein
MSFYPPIYQNGWLGFPTDRDFEFVEHPTKGKCVAASRDFEPGELVFVFTGQLTPRITLRSLRLNEHLHLHDPYFMGFVAHSCEPNCTVDMSKLQFTSTRFIPAGELITMDYMQTEDRLFRRFECSCGTPACRGLIG